MQKNVSIIDSINLTAEYGAPYNENFQNCDGWSCEMTYGGKKYSFPFYMGSGHKGRKPKLKDVLYTLILDARIGNESFESFCQEFGCEGEDTSKERKIWIACWRIAKNMERMFGDLEELANEAEQRGWN